MFEKVGGGISRTQVWNVVVALSAAAVYALPDLQQFLAITFKDQPGYAGLIVAGIKGVDFYLRTITSKPLK